MARKMWDGDTPLFRAVVTVTWKPETLRGQAEGQTVLYGGPFTAQGTATAAIGRLKTEVKSWWWLGGRTAEDIESIEGVVERAAPIWEPVK